MISVGRKDKIIYFKKSLINVVLCLLEGLRALFDMTYNYIQNCSYYFIFIHYVVLLQLILIRHLKLIMPFDRDLW